LCYNKPTTKIFFDFDITVPEISTNCGKIGCLFLKCRRALNLLIFAHPGGIIRQFFFGENEKKNYPNRKGRFTNVS